MATCRKCDKATSPCRLLSLWQMMKAKMVMRSSALRFRLVVEVVVVVVVVVTPAVIQLSSGASSCASV